MNCLAFCKSNETYDYYLTNDNITFITEKGVRRVEKSRFALTARPGQVGLVQFNGINSKAVFPKTKYFTVLHREYSPSSFEGSYVCTLTTRLDKNNNEFYIASPQLQLPSFGELNDFCLRKIFESIPKRVQHDYAFSAYETFIDLISSFTMPLSTITFRILHIYMNGEIESDDVSSEHAREQYDLLLKKSGENTSEDAIKELCEKIDLGKTIRDFIQILYTYTERSNYKEVARLIYLLFRRQSTEDIPYLLIPNEKFSDVYFYNQYKTRYPSGNEVTAAILYANYEVDIVNIPNLIVENGGNCVNYSFNIIDHKQLIIKMKPLRGIQDSGAFTTARKILAQSPDFNDYDMSEFARSRVQSIIRVFGDGDSFLGRFRRKVIFQK